MKLLVGLGNPGSRYANTRHNIGFMVLDRIAKKVPIQLIRSDTLVEMYQTTIEECRVLLLKPQTFMNRSGLAVQFVMQEYAIAPQEIIVIYDDLDLEIGRLRIRKQGGHGGHKGVRSLIEHLDTRNFLRVRMGIGRPDSTFETREDSSRDQIVDYVLQPFSQEEQPVIDEALKRAGEAITLIVTDNVDSAMNVYNRVQEEGSCALWSE